MPIAPNLSIRPHICAPWTTAWTLEHGVAEDHGHALRRGVRRLRGERRARQVLVWARKSKAGKRHRAPAFAIPDTQPGGTADDPQNLPPRTAQNHLARLHLRARRPLARAGCDRTHRRHRRKSLYNSWNWSFTVDPYFAGHSTVALRIRAATGLRSLAIEMNPKRPDSIGILLPPAGWIEDCEGCQRMPHGKPCPTLVFITRPIGESAFIAIWVGAKGFLVSFGGLNSPFRCDWIAMNPQNMQELLPIRISRQKRGEDRRPQRHQRSPRPPDMEIVGRRQGRHGTPLANALLSKSRDQQPAFDQAGVGHRFVRLHSQRDSRRRRTSRPPTDHPNQ